MTPRMVQTMGFSIFAFTVLFVLLLITRSRLRLLAASLREQERRDDQEEFGEVTHA